MAPDEPIMEPTRVVTSPPSVLTHDVHPTVEIDTSEISVDSKVVEESLSTMAFSNVVPHMQSNAVYFKY